MEVERRTRQQSVGWPVKLIRNKCMTIKKNHLHSIPDDLMRFSYL